MCRINFIRYHYTKPNFSSAWITCYIFVFARTSVWDDLKSVVSVHCCLSLLFLFYRRSVYFISLWQSVSLLQECTVYPNCSPTPNPIGSLSFMKFPRAFSTCSSTEADSTLNWGSSLSSWNHSFIVGWKFWNPILQMINKPWAEGWPIRKLLLLNIVLLVQVQHGSISNDEALQVIYI